MTNNMTEKGLDLSALDTVAGANAGFEVMLYHPKTREDTGAVITILGRDSDKFREITNAQSRRRVNKMQKGGFRGANSALTPEELEKEQIDLLAGCTLGWSGINREGVPLEFSVENAKAIYRGFPWIREQVDEAMGDRANFI
jgi:hypothetical protein